MTETGATPLASRRRMILPGGHLRLAAKTLTIKGYVILISQNYNLLVYTCLSQSNLQSLPSREPHSQQGYRYEVPDGPRSRREDGEEPFERDLRPLTYSNRLRYLSIIASNRSSSSNSSTKRSIVADFSSNQFKVFS